MGFTLAEIDKVLLPYAKKTYDNAFKKYFEQCNMKYDESCAMAMGDLKRELEQGFQSLELKLNTVPCSRGDFAFTTVSFGCWNDLELTNKDKLFLKEICSAILNTRMNGHGENHKPVVFPKLVYLYEENYLSAFQEARDVFELAIECSSKCMYPDFLSLTGDMEHNAVAQQYVNHNQVVAPIN